MHKKSLSKNIGFRIYTIITILFTISSQKSYGMVSESSEIEEMQRVVALCGPKPENTYAGHTRRMVWDTRFFHNGVKEALYGTPRVFQDGRAYPINDLYPYPSLKKYYSYNYKAEYDGGGGSLSWYYYNNRGKDPYFDVYAYSACPECDALTFRIQVGDRVLIQPE